MAAVSWTEALRVFFENTDDEPVVEHSLLESVSRALTSKEVKLHDFIETLGPQLSNPDNEQRRRGMQIVSLTLMKLPTNFLSEAEVDTLMVFFSNKLEEKFMIIPYVFKGLLALSKCEHMREGVATKIVQSIFKDSHLQSYMQSDRYTVYTMFANFLESKLEELTKMSSEFVYGFIQIMDGEKDPLCLMTVFHLVPIIIKHFDIGPFTEELFEVTSCYFPVEFTPPPNDPHGITREDLAKGVQRCMAATPKFAEFCIPLLLEKMDSDLVMSKVDAFQALIACSKVYGSNELKPFLPALWSAVRKEVFMPSTEGTEQAALSSLTAIVHSLSSPVIETNSTSVLENFLDTILTECEPTLCKTDTSIIFPCAKLLQAAASGSSGACYQILSVVLPLLLQQFTVNSQVLNRKCIIEVITGFLDVSKQYKHLECDDCPIYKHQESLLTLLFSLLMDSSEHLRKASIQGCKAALDVQGLIKEKHTELLATHLHRLTLEETSSDVREAYLDLLSKLSTLYPVIVEKKIVSHILSELNSNFSHSLVAKMLECIKVAALSHTDLLQLSIPTLMKTLFSHCSELEKFEVAQLVAECITSIVESCTLENAQVQFFVASCLQPLLEFCSEKTKLSVCNTCLSKSVLINSIGRITRKISQALPSKTAQEPVNFTVFLLIGDGTHLENVRKPLKDHSDENLTVLLTVFQSVVCHVKRDVPIPHCPAITSLLLNLATEPASANVSHLAAQCIASFVNKEENEVELMMLVDKISQTLITIVSNELVSPLGRFRAVHCWIWQTKALVLRGHHLMAYSVQQLIKWLNLKSLGSQAAEGFGIIHHQVPEVLSEEGHAIVKIMFHQRFFIETAPFLLQGYQNAPEETRPNYLTAICQQLKFVPKTVLKTELPSLLPLLLQALKSDKEQIATSVLAAFEDLLTDNASLLEVHLHAMLPQLLQLATYERSMAVRCSALHCLTLLTKLPDSSLLPYRQEVIQKLRQCLDDKKRLVRKEAVLARCSWFLIGQPGR